MIFDEVTGGYQRGTTFSVHNTSHPERLTIITPAILEQGLLKETSALSSQPSSPLSSIPPSLDKHGIAFPLIVLLLEPRVSGAVPPPRRVRQGRDHRTAHDGRGRPQPGSSPHGGLGGTGTQHVWYRFFRAVPAGAKGQEQVKDRTGIEGEVVSEQNRGGGTASFVRTVAARQRMSAL